MRNRSIWEKMDDAYTSLMEFFTLIAWAFVVGFLYYFLFSVIINGTL